MDDKQPPTSQETQEPELDTLFFSAGIRVVEMPDELKNGIRCGCPRVNFNSQFIGVDAEISGAPVLCRGQQQKRARAESQAVCGPEIE